MAFCFLFFLSCTKETAKKEDVTNSNLTPLAGDSCAEGQGCTTFTSHTYNVDNIPDYPGCIFPITVMLCVEEDLGEVSHVVVGNYSMGLHTCTDFYDDLLALLETPGETDENEFILDWDETIFTRLEDYIYNEFGNNKVCRPGESDLTVSFVREACSAICFYQFELVVDPKGGKSGDINGLRGPKPTNFVKTSCSTTGCCRRETKMCLDPLTGEIRKTTTNTMYPGSISSVNACAGGNMVPPVIPANTRLIKCNDCTFICPN